MWTETEGSLIRQFDFKDFAHAFAFMTRVSFVAEIMNHHPNWSNSWNRVIIRLTTHDAGDQVTEKDHRLADSIDKIYEEMK